MTRALLLSLVLLSGCDAVDRQIAATDAAIALRPFAPPAPGRYVMDVVDSDNRTDRVEGDVIATVRSYDPSAVTVLLSWPEAPDQGLAIGFDRAEMERARPGEEIPARGIGFGAPMRGQWSGLNRVTRVEGTEGGLDVRFAIVAENPITRFTRLRFYGRFSVPRPA